MLSQTKYTAEYIQTCRAKIDADIERYNYLVATARSEHSTNETLDAAIATFEPVFFNNLLLVLDGYFVHRGKDIQEAAGGSLEEVRSMCQSIMHNSNKMSKDNAINTGAAASVLNYSSGSEIKLNETDFIKLANAFFNEIEGKYV